MHIPTCQSPAAYSPDGKCQHLATPQYNYIHCATHGRMIARGRKPGTRDPGQPMQTRSRHKRPHIESVAAATKQDQVPPIPADPESLACMVCREVVHVGKEFRDRSMRMRMPWTICESCEAKAERYSR
jgi:RNase P subunit RPR2